MGMCYTNVTPQATWRNTLYDSEPWIARPAFMDLPGFEIQFLAGDILHVFHLGVGRDLIGSALRVLLKTDVFAGRTQALRLRTATTRLQEFAQHHGHHLALKRLSSTTLSFGSKKYPEARCKGYDCFTILRWLVHEVTENPPENQALLCAALWAADSTVSIMTNADRFLSEAQHQHKCTVGDLFCRIYLTMAAQAVSCRKYLWRVRPKFHLFHHMLLEDMPSRRNITFMSTWMDEDFLKYAMALKRKVHRRKATRRTLERWLIGLPSLFQHSDVR